MLPPLASRPDSTRFALARAFDHSDAAQTTRAVINIKSRGRWATVLGPHTVRDCLLRVSDKTWQTSTFEFKGYPENWLESLPRHRFGEDDSYFHILADFPGPLLAPTPNGIGVIVIDYDAKTALGFQCEQMSAALDLEVSAPPVISPRHAWERSHLMAGHFPQLVCADVRASGDAPVSQVLDLPAPALSIRNAASWLAMHAADDPQGRKGWYAPLQVPGWTLIAEHFQPLAAFRHLAPHLHPEELRAWQAWAGARWRWPHVAAFASQAALDRGLPQAIASSSPTPIHPAPRL